MSFNVIAGDSINAYTRVKMATSTTIVAGQAIGFTSGLARAATSSDAEIRYVAMESKTTTSSTAYINVADVRVCKFTADTAGNTSQAIVGTKVDLTDAATVNQAATTTKVFFVEDYVGAVANKTVIGYFVSKDA